MLFRKLLVFSLRQQHYHSFHYQLLQCSWWSVMRENRPFKTSQNIHSGPHIWYKFFTFGKVFLLFILWHIVVSEFSLQLIILRMSLWLCWHTPSQDIPYFLLELFWLLERATKHYYKWKCSEYAPTQTKLSCMNSGIRCNCQKLGELEGRGTTDKTPPLPPIRQSSTQ